jgi:hypothetical protein
MKPRTDLIMWVVCILLAGVVLVGVGKLFYQGIQVGNIEVQWLPPMGWRRVGTGRFVTYTCGDSSYRPARVGTRVCLGFVKVDLYDR